jgi:hypothetical protein
MIPIWESLNSAAAILVPISSRLAIHLQQDLVTIEPVVGEALARLFERLASEGFRRVELPGIVALKVVAVRGTGNMKGKATVRGSSNVGPAGRMGDHVRVKARKPSRTTEGQNGCLVKNRVVLSSQTLLNVMGPCARRQ